MFFQKNVNGFILWRFFVFVHLVVELGGNMTDSVKHTFLRGQG